MRASRDRDVRLPLSRRSVQRNPELASTTVEQSPAVSASETPHQYPNPGFLGSSSHAMIFNRLRNDQGQTSATLTPSISGGLSPGHLNNKDFSLETDVLNEITTAIDMQSFSKLIDFWLAKQINLALGGSFVTHCTETVQQTFSAWNAGPGRLQSLAKRLSENSSRGLTARNSSSFADYCNEFCGVNIRWETLALALVAGARAATDISFFPPLFRDRAELQEYQRLVTRLADRCLEITLSLDRLNDLQFITQYENWILHSIVDGDQSKKRVLLALANQIGPSLLPLS